ncbi:MAG: ANTAR domain-containing protein [Clostridiales bacterium]|nr:ANTAR domain-containing protein [Clostridiales bacterium]
MKRLILAFANADACQNIRALLEAGGIAVNKACCSGAEVLREAAKADSGVVVCGFKLRDMTAEVLNGMLPDGYVTLLLASPAQGGCGADSDVIRLNAPVNKNELKASVIMIQQMQRIAADKRKARAIANKREQALPVVERAKGMLMARHGLTEEDAHKMLQKRSMDSGRKITDTAEMILSENTE